MNARQEALIRYGGDPPKCLWCGALESLEIDHIVGNGGLHRRDMAARGTTIVWELRRLGYPCGYQILCRDCHVMKSYGLTSHDIQYYTREASMVAKNGHNPKNLSLSVGCIEHLRDLAFQRKQSESAIVEQAIEHEIEGPNGKGAIRIGMLHQRQGELLTAIEALTAQASILVGQVHAIDGRLARVDARLDALGSKADSNKTVLDHIIDVLKRLESWTQKGWFKR